MKRQEGSSPPTFTIVMPSVSSDEVSNGLRDLTQAIVEHNPDLHQMGLFGGTFGYGALWDDDIFSMHPFCWCDAEDCPWCEEEASNFHHKKTGFKVRWYKYIGRGMEVEGQCDWNKALPECLSSISKTAQKE